jgi:hypothetical protein
MLGAVDDARTLHADIAQAVTGVLGPAVPA